MQFSGLVVNDELIREIKFDSNYKEVNEIEENSETIEIDDDKHELDNLQQQANEFFIEWKNVIKDYESKMGDKPENFYLLFFMGKKLNKLTKENFKHYLRYINSNNEIEESKIEELELDKKNSHTKLKQILDFFKNNLNQIRIKECPEKNIKLMKNVFNFKWNKINYTLVSPGKMHHSIMIILNSILEINLELNQIFHCSKTTSLEELNSKFITFLC
jgi:hypothetical protein